MMRDTFNIIKSTKKNQDAPTDLDNEKIRIEPDSLDEYSHRKGGNKPREKDKSRQFKKRRISTIESTSGKDSSILRKSKHFSKRDILWKEDSCNRKIIIEKLKKRSKYELMYEAFYVANLFYFLNETNLHANDEVFYIISTKWFERWKTYVNFDHFMSNTEKYLRLNQLGNDTNMDKSCDSNSSSVENFLLTLDEHICFEINKFFDNYFLSSNEENFPGGITNKELLYDKGLYFMDFNNPKSHLNYNIIDQYENGKDYFIVPHTIWKYFKGVYGGKEIKRFRQYTGQVKDREIFIEAKLKTITLCITRFRTIEGSPFSMKFAERPKLFFIHRKASLYDLKKHLINIFTFLKDSLSRDVRLWILDPKFTFESFEEYVIQHFNETKYIPKESIPFPGFCLDLFDSEVTIEAIDQMIQNKIIILEYIDDIKLPKFLFKRQHLSDFSKEIREKVKLIQKEQDLTIQGMYYDVINLGKVKIKEFDNQSLFKIKNYFGWKYRINADGKCSIEQDKLIATNAMLEAEFAKEVEILRQNMHLIFDKYELLFKFSYGYNNSFTDYRANTTYLPKSTTKDVALSRQDMIMKKRERSKYLEQFKNKKEKEIKEIKEDTAINTPDKTENSHAIISLTNLSNEETPINEDKCNYCTKVLEDVEPLQCLQCKKVKYCNSFCMMKDQRFHNKKCE